MANLYSQDSSPNSHLFTKDFHIHHPVIHKYILKSNKINLNAPIIKDKIKQIESQTQIEGVSKGIRQLGTILNNTQAYKDVFVEIVPNNNQCKIQLFPTTRQDASYNFRIETDKPNTFSLFYHKINLLSYFQTMNLGFRNRYDNQSRSLFFDFNFPIRTNKYFHFRSIWRNKKLDQSSKQNLVGSQFMYSYAPTQFDFKRYYLRIANRSNTLQNYNTPRKMQASNLYEIAYQHKKNITPDFSATLQTKLGIVPIKQSYFTKFKIGLDNFKQFTSIGLRQKHIAQIQIGKNVILNDLLQYRPMKRSQAYLCNKMMVYLLNYPHMPVAPLFSNVPYTYITHWASYDHKSQKSIKNQFQLGVGALLLGHEIIGIKFSVEFSCLRYENKKLKWSPGFTFATGDQ